MLSFAARCSPLLKFCTGHRPLARTRTCRLSRRILASKDIIFPAHMMSNTRQNIARVKRRAHLWYFQRLRRMGYDDREASRLRTPPLSSRPFSAYRCSICVAMAFPRPHTPCVIYARMTILMPCQEPLIAYSIDAPEKLHRLRR